MTKEDFKTKVLDWLAQNNFLPKKVRVYKYRGEWEVRVYGEPIEITNTRKSFRERKEERDEQRHGTYGIHTRNISSYCPINETNLGSKEEREFTLQVLRDSF
jgi:hypothetical protein